MGVYLVLLPVTSASQNGNGGIFMSARFARTSLAFSFINWSLRVVTSKIDFTATFTPERKSQRTRRLRSRNALPNVLEPIKRDVDLVWLRPVRRGLGLRNQYDEVSAIRRDVVTSWSVLHHFDRQSRGVPDNK